MRRLAQSTAYTVMLKLFLSSDHVSAATGKTVAIKISKAGGAFADPNAGASNATEVSNGWYKFALDTTDTATLGDLVVRGTSASCDDAEQICQVVSATTGGATNLDAAVSAVKAKTDSLTFTVAGMVDSNVVDWKGATAPAMTGDAYARLGAPAGASVSADIAGVQSDTDNIQTRLPAALVSGRIDASVGAMASGVLTATAIAADAITDAKVASDVTIASVTGSVGSVTGAVGSVTGLTASDVGAIKAKTDNLPSDPADASDVAAAITAVQNHGDTYWLTATGFSTSADITGAVSALEGYGDTNWSTATGFSTLDAAGVRGAVGLAAANLDTQIGTLATASALATTDGKADAIQAWQDAIVQTAGKLWVLDESGNALPHVADVKTQADQALADAGVTTTVTGRIDVATSTRLAATDYTAPDDTSVLSAIGGLNDLSAAEVNAEVDTAISDAALATAANLATTDGKVDGVKAKTDDLNFTGGAVDANIAKVNGVTVAGNGTTGSEWGPA